MEFHHQPVAAAIRRSYLPNDRPDSDAVLLGEVIAHQIFERRALAAPEVLRSRTIAALEEWVAASEHNDEAIYDRFQALIANALSSIELDAVSFLGDDCVEFVRQAAICFGVEEVAIPHLLVQFHRLPEAARVGIYLRIDQSAPFQFLSAEIDSAPEGTPFENPEKALRTLLVATLEAAEQG